MSELDAAIDTALARLLDRMRRDPEEAARRASRAAHSCHRRPVSPWRLAIRASDRRIDHICHLSDPDKARLRCPHGVLITCDAAIELCSPVRIDWPGVDWRIAADRLGLSRIALHHWIKSGVFQVSYCYARAAGRPGGKKVPFVWAPSPLDPMAVLGRAPHPAWGTLWQHMAEDVPVEHAWSLLREPHFVQRRGPYEDFLGWRWVCPGRIWPIPDGVTPVEPAPQEQIQPLHPIHGGGTLFADLADVETPHMITIHDQRYWHVPCGRAVKIVYLPMPPWTVPDALGLWDLLAEHGIPPPPDHRREPFACAHCWGLRTGSLLGSHGWNRFISYISGGLLYGHEVPRVGAESEQRRLNRYHRCHLKEKVPGRRCEILRQVREGSPYRTIARDLGITSSTVFWYAKQAMAEHNVTTRRELEARLREIADDAPAPARAQSQ